MDRDPQPPFGPDATSESTRDYNVVSAALIGVATLVFVGGFGLISGIFQAGSRNGYAQEHVNPFQAPPADPLAKLFQGWQRPEVAILLSGEQHGYLQPCGCSSPQYGGLARRFNLIQTLRQRGWPIVSVDLGDLNQKVGPSGLSNVQGQLKYKYAMAALDVMGYSAVNFGEYEMAMPLADALATYALNNQSPRIVSANLLTFAQGQSPKGMVFDSEIAAKHAGPKLGIFGLTALSVEKTKKDPGVTFSPETVAILAKTLPNLKAQGAEMIVLLYQGNTDEAKALAKHVLAQHQQNPVSPLIDIILCVSDNPTHIEPPAQPWMEGSVMIVEVGHKGKYVGVVGAFRHNTKAPFQLKYQLVSIGPEFETPKNQESGNPVMKLMEEYTAELKAGNYLANYKQTNHPVQIDFPSAEYIGTGKCVTCHEHAEKIWKTTAHSHAYKTLVDVKNPSLRQFDGECIVCHTVGFGYKTGFEDANKSAKLLDVGCESCHGPGSEHAAKPKDKGFRAALNPLKFKGNAPEAPAALQMRMNKIGDLCMKCHDQENDVHFNFAVAWPKVIHMTPPAAGANPAQAKGASK